METRLLPRAEHRRQDVVADLDPKTSAALGQFMTPPPVAAFLASLFDLPSDGRLLGAGAGVASLSAAMADRWMTAGTGNFDVTAVEFDPKRRAAALENRRDPPASPSGPLPSSLSGA